MAHSRSSFTALGEMLTGHLQVSHRFRRHPDISDSFNVGKLGVLTLSELLGPVVLF
jgi:hypothetical protein